jgi:hypothetical protein
MVIDYWPHAKGLMHAVKRCDDCNDRCTNSTLIIHCILFNVVAEYTGNYSGIILYHNSLASCLAPVASSSILPAAGPR